MYAKMYLTLSKDEHKALQAAANQELRGMQEQARFFIRKELEKKGLLSQSETYNQKPSQESVT